MTVNDVVAEDRTGEVRLPDGTPRRIRASRDDEQIVHATVRRAIGVANEARLANRAVRSDERRYGVSGAVLGCDLYLWIDGRTGAADGRLQMAARATVEVEARAQAVGHRIDFLKYVLGNFEESLFRVGETGERVAGSGRAAAHTRIECPVRRRGCRCRLRQCELRQGNGAQQYRCEARKRTHIRDSDLGHVRSPHALWTFRRDQKFSTIMGPQQFKTLKSS